MLPGRRWIIALSCASWLPLAPPAARAVDVTLIWTCTGDDGRVGAATTYDMRFATAPITELNFAQWPRVTGLPVPNVAGVMQVAIVRGLAANTTYYFALKAADERGNWSPMSNVAIHTAAIVAVDGERAPLVFSDPWPNPVGAEARFRLSVPEAARVRVEVYDPGGRKVRTLYDGIRAPGLGVITWDLRDESGRRVRSGIYLVKAILPGQVVTRRALVLR